MPGMAQLPLVLLRKWVHIGFLLHCNKSLQTKWLKATPIYYPLHLPGSEIEVIQLILCLVSHKAEIKVSTGLLSFQEALGVILLPNSFRRLWPNSVLAAGGEGSFVIAYCQLRSLALLLESAHTPSHVLQVASPAKAGPGHTESLCPPLHLHFSSTTKDALIFCISLTPVRGWGPYF